MEGDESRYDHVQLIDFFNSNNKPVSGDERWIQVIRDLYFVAFL